MDGHGYERAPEATDSLEVPRCPGPDMRMFKADFKKRPTLGRYDLKIASCNKICLIVSQEEKRKSGPRITDKRITDQRINDQRIMDQGSRIKYQESRIMDQGSWTLFWHE